MVEPVWSGPHMAMTHRPELEGKQILFDCGNGYGLSVVTAKGSRWEHGLYCDDNTYEVCLIEIKEGHTSQGKPNFDLPKNVEPVGWRSIEEVGELALAVEANGRDGWSSWNKPFED